MPYIISNSRIYCNKKYRWDTANAHLKCCAVIPASEPESPDGTKIVCHHLTRQAAPAMTMNRQWTKGVHFSIDFHAKKSIIIREVNNFENLQKQSVYNC